MNTQNRQNKILSKITSVNIRKIEIFVVVTIVFCMVLFTTAILSARGQTLQYIKSDATSSSSIISPEIPEVFPLPLDPTLYDKKMLELADGTTTGRWPVKTVYPNGGAILPFKRIIAYYGNLYSKHMGILGEYPKDEMLSRLDKELKKWNRADPTTPTIPALHYIVTTAQESPAWDGKYRLRMPASEIDKVIEMAKEDHALVFLDIQVAKSSLQAEIPLLENYLKMPQVHLGIDPEFSMKTGAKPGKVVGTMDAADINYAAKYLALLVNKYHLPPKILVIHRFTRNMVTNYKKITPLHEVQIVMDMDGWGTKAKKINTYQTFIAEEPVQFTGFKLFYKNDIKTASTSIMTPSEVLKLRPKPVYIQYQ